MRGSRSATTSTRRPLRWLCASLAAAAREREVWTNPSRRLRVAGLRLATFRRRKSCARARATAGDDDVRLRRPPASGHVERLGGSWADGHRLMRAWPACAPGVRDCADGAARPRPGAPPARPAARGRRQALRSTSPRARRRSRARCGSARGSRRIALAAGSGVLGCCGTAGALLTRRVGRNLRRWGHNRSVGPAEHRRRRIDLRRAVDTGRGGEGVRWCAGVEALGLCERRLECTVGGLGQGRLLRYVGSPRLRRHLALQRIWHIGRSLSWQPVASVFRSAERRRRRGLPRGPQMFVGRCCGLARSPWSAGACGVSHDRPVAGASVGSSWETTSLTVASGLPRTAAGSCAGAGC